MKSLAPARPVRIATDLLAWSADVLDRIDEIVPPGTEVGRLDQDHLPPALTTTSHRRRPGALRAGEQKEAL